MWKDWTHSVDVNGLQVRTIPFFQRNDLLRPNPVRLPSHFFFWGEMFRLSSRFQLASLIPHPTTVCICVYLCLYSHLYLYLYLYFYLYLYLYFYLYLYLHLYLTVPPSLQSASHLPSQLARCPGTRQGTLQRLKEHFFSQPTVGRECNLQAWTTVAETKLYVLLSTGNHLLAQHCSRTNNRHTGQRLQWRKHHDPPLYNSTTHCHWLRRQKLLLMLRRPSAVMRWWPGRTTPSAELSVVITRQQLQTYLFSRAVRAGSSSPMVHHVDGENIKQLEQFLSKFFKTLFQFICLLYTEVVNFNSMQDSKYNRAVHFINRQSTATGCLGNYVDLFQALPALFCPAGHSLLFSLGNTNVSVNSFVLFSDAAN